MPAARRKSKHSGPSPARRWQIISSAIVLPAVLVYMWLSNAWSLFQFRSENPHLLCDSSQAERTSLISLDPLIIYVRDFLSPSEISALLTVAESHFGPSPVYDASARGDTRHQGRTSSTAFLPPSDFPVASCILSRARQFMGTALGPSNTSLSDFSVPQLVRYGPGQKFDVHHDAFPQPRMDQSAGRQYNRMASFFVYLEDDCVDCETWFPHVEPAGIRWGPWDTAKSNETESVMPKSDEYYRNERQGGIMFPPISGNALFWSNLKASGQQDGRVLHAGLPVGEGRKTAMNIWAKRWF
ncbi:hypothetical protein BDY21DRAFT_357818 [Lineolata rhizophorae]|uniref:Fe2OG dioxygenase domain-containing protein n=1 Tax=Lineolata rhizophorae TaxID=578093 RepID=A0A6A6NMD0_9PEZI|nr:hypothetical protein BDY21DRAFT_357818 [Lineolata rhizophorae]